MTIQLVSMGEPLIEFNQKENSGLFELGYGGDTSNTVIAAARHGVRSAYFSHVGADKFGQMLKKIVDGRRCRTIHMFKNLKSHLQEYILSRTMKRVMYFHTYEKIPQRVGLLPKMCQKN